MLYGLFGFLFEHVVDICFDISLIVVVIIFLNMCFVVHPIAFTDSMFHFI